MATLREIKGRIGSVSGTLKITSAMKLVASAKMRRAQTAAETMLAYSKVLEDIISSVPVPEAPESDDLFDAADGNAGKTLVVAICSNTSLCGSFNINAIKTALKEASAAEDSEILAIGRKMSEAVTKAGYPQKRDLSHVSGSPEYEPCAAIAEEIAAKFEAGEYSKVVLVHNHFYSKSHQAPVVEQFLPVKPAEGAGDAAEADKDAYILEPGAQEILLEVMPQMQKLKLYAAVLDSAAAEHAARTMAMQAATDNAEELLSELTLEYNKRRQEKITSEILDIVGGSIR